MIKVLVVDDSRIMRNIVKNIFNTLKIPCEFLEAGDGKTAYKLLESHEVSLVLLDWNMPEMNGLDFLKAARKIEKYRDVPIIMVTSEAAKYNVVEALKSGATDYIIKPINERIFTEKLSELNLKG